MTTNLSIAFVMNSLITRLICWRTIADLHEEKGQNEQLKL